MWSDSCYLMKNFLTAKEVQILQEAHHDSRLRKYADRIKTILFLNQGFSYEETAQLLMLDETTVRRYEKEFKTGGVDQLIENNYQGSGSFLTIKQQQELTLQLKDKTYQTVKEVVILVRQKYQVVYSVEGMTYLLHKLGFVYKKTKAIPAKFDPKQQQEFINQYEKLKTTKQPEDKIYFLDSTHPQHNNMPFYGWIYKGSIKTIKSNTGRERLNLNGALSLEDLGITVLEEKTINSQAMMRLLLTLQQSQVGGRIFCIVDNARYNHSKELKRFLKRHHRIKLIYLPPYSPNLNLIERLWLLFKREQLTNHYYSTFKEFKTSALSFFQDIHLYQQELKSLMTDSFQTLPY